MSKRKKPVNPFYVLLVLAGLAFLVTACTYGVMSYRAVEMAGGALEDDGLMRWIDDNGIMLMLAQVGFIGLFSVVAMATDSYWDRLARPTAKTASQHKRESNEGRAN